MKDKQLYLGLGIIAGFMLIAIFAPLLAPFSPFEQDLLHGMALPDGEHLLGRDILGRDILSRMIYGSRVSIMVGVVVITICCSVGTLIGAVAGGFGGRVDSIIMRFIDIVMAFPGILLAIAVMSILGPGLQNLMVALCLTGWVGFARIARGQILSLRERDFVTAAVAMGSSPMRVILKHLIPNAAAPLIVEAAFGMAAVIVAEAGLSFLGLGIQPPAASWGSMLNDGRPFLLIAPHLTGFPGIALFLLVLGINLAGDGLRDRLDPKS